MTISEFKKMGRLLKTIYAEIQKQALEEGYDIGSPEYEELISRVREKTLAKRGFTLEEYRAAKTEYESSRKTQFDKVLDKALQLKGEPGEIGAVGPRGEQGPVGPRGPIGPMGPRGQKGERGPAGKDGRDGKNGEMGEIDEATIGYLENEIHRVEEKIPEPFDPSELKNEFYREMDVIQGVINGMPDFRKLGMGLQAQLDTKIEGVNVRRIIYSATQPTNPQLGDIWIAPA